MALGKPARPTNGRPWPGSAVRLEVAGVIYHGVVQPYDWHVTGSHTFPVSYVSGRSVLTSPFLVEDVRVVGGRTGGPDA